MMLLGIDVDMRVGQVSTDGLAWHIDVGVNSLDVHCDPLAEYIEDLLNECDDRATPIQEDPDEVFLGMFIDTLTKQLKAKSTIPHEHTP